MSGNPVSKASVVFTDTTGAIRIAVSNPFGYYRFDEVDVGQVYVIEVRSKRFQFVPQVVTVLDELSNLNFVALP